MKLGVTMDRYGVSARCANGGGRAGAICLGRDRDVYRLVVVPLPHIKKETDDGNFKLTCSG
jgi:hypothetical protein